MVVMSYLGNTYNNTTMFTMPYLRSTCHRLSRNPYLGSTYTIPTVFAMPYLWSTYTITTAFAMPYLRSTCHRLSRNPYLWSTYTIPTAFAMPYLRSTCHRLSRNPYLGSTYTIPTVFANTCAQKCPCSYQVMYVSFTFQTGQGDMAISNTIGSNVFDILIGLALPWWIKTVCVNPGTSVSHTIL